MSWRPLSVIILLVLTATLPPCGPWYDDAHYGQSDALHRVGLPEFCYALFHAEGSIAARIAEGQAAVVAAEAAETNGDWNAASPWWTTACVDLQGYGDEVLAARCADRVDLYASDASVADMAAYCRARDADDVRTLEKLRAAHGSVADNAACALAVIAVSNGDRAAAAVIVDGFATTWPGSEKTDTAAYLSARLKLNAWYAKTADDASVVVTAFNDYLTRFPGGRYRADALGWLAHVRWVQNPGDADAVAIYVKLFLDPDLHGLFVPTVNSLHLVFRRMSDESTPELLADPRIAAACLYDRSLADGWDQTAGRPLLAAAARSAAHVLPDLARTTLPPGVLSGLAMACFTAGAPDAASALANAVLQRVPDATAYYLQARILAEAKKPLEAEFCFERLLLTSPADDRLADLGMRIGAAFESQGDQILALRCYLRVDSEMDALIVADGEITVEDLQRYVGGCKRLVAEVHRQAEPQDRLPWLRDILAARLARIGRLAEALPLAADKRATAITELMDLERRAAQANEAAKPAADYAVAAFWYRRGKEVVHVTRHWHQCFADSLVNALVEGDVRDREREKNLLAMTSYERARPLFEAIAERFPASPEAPKALYSAALCDYWLCGDTYLGQSEYWKMRTTRDHYWRRGDDAMRLLRKQYPDHPLARSEWMAKVPGDE